MKHCNESPEKAFNLKAKNIDLVWWFSEWACPDENDSAPFINMNECLFAVMDELC